MRSWRPDRPELGDYVDGVAIYWPRQASYPKFNRQKSMDLGEVMDSPLISRKTREALKLYMKKRGYSLVLTETNVDGPFYAMVQVMGPLYDEPQTLTILAYDASGSDAAYKARCFPFFMESFYNYLIAFNLIEFAESDLRDNPSQSSNRQKV